MWFKLLDRMLSRFWRQGSLEVVYPDGERRKYGDGTGAGVRLRLKNEAVIRRIVLGPDLAVGEAYMDGQLEIEDDDVRGFFAEAIRNVDARHLSRWHGLAEVGRTMIRRWRQFAPRTVARSNVAHHYDLSAELYELFLDNDRQYSCAYFSDPAMTLEEAQNAKKHHIASKLMIEPGMKVLDIGCGWGGMGLTLARDYGARVVGVTLSQEQHKIACERVRAEGLEAQVDFRLTDYRNVTETFDRIVSVGMFEHVGVPHYREYFRNVNNRLRDDGIALIHSIGRVQPPGATSPWIDKYIFPGGYCPSLSEMIGAVEKEHLYFTDIEIWRLHYAETLRHWYLRFEAQEDKARELYDERFCRMWRYYLAASEMTFRHGRQAVFQVQMAHRQDAVPLTRDYLYREGAGHMRLAAE